MSITYAAYDNVLRDDTGRAIVNAEIYVYRADTGTLAQLYDLAGNPVGQPLSTDQHGGIDNGSTHSAEARQGFRAPGGRYLIRSFKNGVEGRRIPEVMIGTAATRDVTTSPTDTTAGRVLKVGDFGVGEAVPLPYGADLNTVVNSGFYRLDTSAVNAPVDVEQGQLIVSRGLNTIVQIVTGFYGGEIYWRQGNPPDVGGIGVWYEWHRFYHSGNLALPIGVGQAWQDVTSSRERDTTYTNTTGRPIMVAITLTGSGDYGFSVDGVTVAFGSVEEGDSINPNVWAVVPVGGLYRMSSYPSIHRWTELR